MCNPRFSLRCVTDPSDVVNAEMAKQTKGRQLVLRPQLALWLLFGWFGWTQSIASTFIHHKEVRSHISVYHCSHTPSIDSSSGIAMRSAE